MANAVHGHYALVVLTPIVPGEEGELTRYLDALPTGADSPLARLEGTHLGRWVVIPQLVYQGPPQKRDELKSQYLLFTAHFDGDLDGWIDDMCAQMGGEADAIWGHCVAYPGSADPSGAKRYFRHNQLKANLHFPGYPGASVQAVRDALKLRTRVVDFAVRAQRMDASQLQDAFRQTFGRDRQPARTDVR